MNKTEARKHLARLMTKDEPIVFSGHAKEEMSKDNLRAGDIENVLKSTSAKIEEGEFERGSYRYQVRTTRITVVIAFSMDGNKVIIVTAWRLQG